MKKIDNSGWKRDPSTVLKKIKKVGNSLVTTDDLFIYFPQKFVDKELTTIDNITKMLGIVAIVDTNDKYGIMTIPANLYTTPNEIEDIIINDEPYIRFIYEKGSEIVNDINIVMNQDFVFKMFELFLLQGKVPFYIEYEDLLTIFTNLPKYAGGSVGKNSIPFEILIALNARADNTDIDFRTIIKTNSDKVKFKPNWIGLKNIHYAFRSTVSKLTGAYMKKGIVASIVKPAKTTTNIEKILKA